METIDNTISYHELIMTYNDTSKYIEYLLPDGYHFEYYKNGDKKDWIDIHISSGEFTSIVEGERYFYQYYDCFLHELNKRCIFIVDELTNEKIGTATVSLLKEEELGYKATVDWLAIKKEYQGKKLARALIFKCISLANQLGHDKIILHTQTTTWLAAKLYLDAGFQPFNMEAEVGWRILKTLTNHKRLQQFETVSEDVVYDKRNMDIKRQLCDIYKTDDFNYSIWYKNGLHNVYVYCDGISDEYEYFEENGTIRLEKVYKKGR